MRWAAIIPVALAALPVLAQTPGESIELALEHNRSALAAQRRIDGLFRERQRILDDIAIVEADGTADAVRNRELEQSLAAVRQNLAEIDADLRAMTETQTGIVALLDAMIGALGRFIELDLPFRLDQRREVVATLRAQLGRSDIGVTEKYQSVVSAYLDEIRFGHSSDVTRQRIETPAGSRLVDVLRLGRAGLWYVSADGAHAGRWDPARRAWTDTGTEAAAVRAGIAVVRDTGATDRVRLPVGLDIP